MKKNQQSQIFQTINSLTNDEDHQQQLWVCYLSGDTSAALNTRLATIKQEDESYNRLQEAVWEIHRKPPTSYTLTFLKNFSEFEQSIMLLLLMGYTVNEVSEYKDISLVRVRQIITAIGKNPTWEDRWL